MENNQIKRIKSDIETLINKKHYKEAIDFLEELIEIVEDDYEIYSMYGVALSMIGKFKEAIDFCMKGLDIAPYNFDLNYNLGCLYENIKDYSKALTFFELALNECEDEAVRENINLIIDNLKGYEGCSSQKKLVFFVKNKMDAFLTDIIEGLSNNYIVKKIIVTDFDYIDKWMEWSDICWFEWCDELVEYGSKLPIANRRKIICRIHRYEVFTNNIFKVNWNNVDSLTVVTKHLKKIIKEKISDIEYKVNIEVINNGVNLKNYNFKNREKGFNIAYVGYIHERKNPSLILQVINKLVKIDSRYKLYIAGNFQDELIKLYWDYEIEKMNLQNNIIFEGWQEDINKWLDDKNYILSSSIHESFGYGIAEAMSSGVKPIIHDFIFSQEIWDKKYIWNTIDEAIEMIGDNEYNSKEYRDFIEKNYSLFKQINEVNSLIKKVLDLKKNKNNEQNEFNYKEYWENRYKNGGTSGEGSYGKLADFKAEIINKLIEDNNINSIIEFGCGDGNQLKLMNYNRYIGLDVSKNVVEKCIDIFKDDINKEFYIYNPGSLSDDLKNMDMTVCLDVLYHIVDEQDYIKTLNDIFSISSEFVVLYTILEELNMPLALHMKCRNLIDYLKRYKNYSIYKIVKQRYKNESYADFIILKKKEEIIDVSYYNNALKISENFSKSTKELINRYDFNGNRVLMGKIERLFEDKLLIEYILENNENKQLAVTGIIFNEEDDSITYPNYIKDSNKVDEISYITNNLIINEKRYINEYIHGFIYEDSIKKQIEENKLAYSWERAIPGTEFMSFAGYLAVALRYEFSGRFIKENDHVLEAASGFGYGAAYISTICRRVEALDIANENINFGKKTYNIENINWLEGDVTNLPYGENVFDIYISYETFEHLHLDVIDNYFSEANKVLKKGGKFIISTPNESNRKNINNPFHIKEYNILEFNEILQKYFENIEYYSVEGLKLVKGISSDSNIMIAVLYN